MREHRISKLLSVGDFVFSAANGMPMKVISKDSSGFETEEDYFSYDEHRELYWLHSKSYSSERKEGADNA